VGHRDLLAGIHALVIDDDEDARTVLDGVLSYHGALVTAVDSAEGALSVLDRVTPDVILSDIAMPQRDGIWLLNQVRERQRATGRYIPVIAVTASHWGAHRARFDDYLIKPVNLDRLCSCILRLASREPYERPES
jgi:CheY-like chemotaxis protein